MRLIHLHSWKLFYISSDFLNNSQIIICKKLKVSIKSKFANNYLERSKQINIFKNDTFICISLYSLMIHITEFTANVKMRERKKKICAIFKLNY
jgi:hypothetical protein